MSITGVINPFGRRRSKSSSGSMQQDLSAILTEALQQRSRTTTGTGTERTRDYVDQSDGLRRLVTKKVVGGRKKTNIGKLLRSTVNYTEQCLGVRLADGTFVAKHPVSEFNPGRGGAIPIAMNSVVNTTPMHCYDLNLYIGGTDDTLTNYPVTSGASTSATTQCDNVNARTWFWTNDNKWGYLADYVTNQNQDFRWYVNEPRTSTQLANPSTKVYRKGIAIDFMVYGCKKMATEYDIRVIKINDPKMCPDYGMSLIDDSVRKVDELSAFRQNWSNLVRMWTCNPMLRGIEPGPKPVKRWFTTVAKKRITIGEQTGDIESPPCVQGKIYVKINEAQRYAWDEKDFTTESGDNAYDKVPNVDDNGTNNNFRHKPYYTSRYYLLIRAISPMDTCSGAETGVDEDLGAGVGEGGAYPGAYVQNGLTNFDYTPSYDLAVRTTFLTVNAN